MGAQHPATPGGQNFPATVNFQVLIVTESSTAVLFTSLISILFRKYTFNYLAKERLALMAAAS